MVHRGEDMEVGWDDAAGRGQHRDGILQGWDSTERGQHRDGILQGWDDAERGHGSEGSVGGRWMVGPDDLSGLFQP